MACSPPQATAPQRIACLSTCLDFKAEKTKGVYVSHDADGQSLAGLPKKQAGSFNGGDWMVRVSLDRFKEQTSTGPQPATQDAPPAPPSTQQQTQLAIAKTLKW